MADEVKDAIEKNAPGPQSAKGDVGEVRQHSLKDQIEAAANTGGHATVAGSQSPTAPVLSAKVV